MLFQKIKLIAPSHPLNDQIVDIRIEGNYITAIQPAIIPYEKEEVWHQASTSVSIAWCDMWAQVGEPGLEHRESYDDFERAALAGGFSSVAVLPNTKPVNDTKTAIHYILRQSEQRKINFIPIGAISEGCMGKDLAEMYDMHHAGAKAFSDGKQTIQDTGLLMRALEYTKAFDGLVMNMPNDKQIALDGMMHEGHISTILGLKGIPALAEEMMVRRDIYLLEYIGGRLHLANISTERSVEWIQEAKQKGLALSCSVSALNLFFTDDALSYFDTNYKVLPPLRSENHRKALIQGVLNGTIDAIHSNHIPLEEDAKKCEFPYAGYGAIGLETCFAAAWAILYPHISIQKMIELVAIRPRQIMGIELPSLEVGQVANLTFFDSEEKWIFEQKNIYSSSKNTPFLGQELKGRVKGVYSKGQFFSF